MELRIGDLVGDYRVIGAIGAGGMGAVYKVEHCITKRVEALKALSTGIGISDDEVARFEREIQVQARMQHPNIASVYSAFRHGNFLALVMEYVEGESLREFLDRERLSTPAALRIAADLLSALDCAHRNGVVHGDVSPGNIMMTASGAAKLTDFGLCREAVAAQGDGVAVGTPFYMSPEQVRGLAIDARSDVYAAGAVLYEMVAGRKLFDGESRFDLLRAQVERVPEPPSRFATVPPALNTIVLKALAKDPALRFQTAAEFRDALARISAPGRVNGPVLAAFAVVTIIATSGALVIRSNKALPDPLPPTPASRDAATPPLRTPAPAPAVEPPVEAPPARSPARTPVASPGPSPDPELKPRTVRHQLATGAPPSNDDGSAALPAAPEPQSAAPGASLPLPEVSLPLAAPAAQPASPGAEPPKPQPKGNRLVRALGKINPFRRASKNEPEQP